MSSDKRNNARVKLNISCTFGPNPETPRSATVTSISVSGCFVKTKGWATKGQKMYLRLWLPEGQWLPLQGIVLYHMERIGFGLTFEGIDANDEVKIRELVRHAQDGADNSPLPPAQ